LSGAGSGGDARARMDGDASDVLAHHLALTGMQSRTDVNPDLSHLVADRTRGAHSTRGPVEGREKSVTGRIDFAAAESIELSANNGMVTGEQLGPPMVAELSDASRRLDDVGEEIGGENAVGLWRRAHTRDELFDLSEDRIPVLRPPRVVRARELHEPRTRDLRRDVPTLFDLRIAVVGPMNDDRGHANRRQDVTDVDVGVHLHQCE